MRPMQVYTHRQRQIGAIAAIRGESRWFRYDILYYFVLVVFEPPRAKRGARGGASVNE
jgi:hypothetical protein